ncbi:hypothetical protein FD723_31375 [Nostoc sp. C052]|nr:hypothetical protein FD723_31375 [Nostoc sp. C052]
MCDFISNLTPNPFPTREGEQESKPLSVSGRGLERGSNFGNCTIPLTNSKYFCVPNIGRLFFPIVPSNL